MAQNLTQSLFQDLGISEAADAQLLQKFTQQQQAQQGGAPETSAQRLGRAAGTGLGGLAAGLGSFFGKDKHLSFAEKVRKTQKEAADRKLAQAKGISFEELRKEKVLRQKIDNIEIERTGDPFKDQDAMLKEVIRLAAEDDNQDLVTKAQAKRLKLRKENLELRTAEAGAKTAEAEASEAERIEEQNDSVGRPMILQGDDINKPHSVGMLNDDGSWNVVRPDGSVVQQVDGGRITFVDPVDKAKQRTRLFETFDAQMKNALQVNGLTGGGLRKIRDTVIDMGTQAGIINDLTTGLLNMYDPDLAFDLSAKTLIGVDKLATFAGNVSEVFSRQGDQQQKNWEITWMGKKISQSEQVRKATNTDILDDFLGEQGVDLTTILPPHIKADSREAQLFAANIMQLAFLDARLQEPSNRGLSDNDIKAALLRIGVDTADPTVFARRQKQIIARLNGRIDNLGLEYSATSQIAKDGPGGIREFVYQPALIKTVRTKLSEADDKLTSFLSGGSPAQLSGMSIAELDKAIEEAQKK